MATPGQQAAAALQSGGVTRFADTNPNQDDGVQLANFLTTIIKKSAKGAAREGTIVPEPPTERLLPEGQTTESVQEELAPQMLSPEGQQRFEAGGADARTAIATPTEREIQGGVAEPVLVDPPAADVAVTETAEKARRGFSTGQADEGDADDLIRMITEPGMVDDAVGVDFNFDKFEGGEDINRVINSMSEIIANPTEAAKRGVRTNDETLAAADQLLADEMGLTKTLLRKKAGSVLNAEEMTAVRILLQRSAAKLETLAKQIEAGEGSPALLVEFRRQMSIHAGIQMKAKGAQTEIARALQAFKIPAGTQVPAEALNALLQETGGDKLATSMARGYLDALKEGGQANANKYVAGAWYQRIEGVWMEVYINGLLSYFPTHLKNGLGNPLFMVYNTLTDLGAATIGTGLRAGGRVIGKDANPEGVYFEDVFARIYGFTQSFGDALVTAGKTFKDEAPADALNKVEAGTLRAIDAENLNITNNTVGQAVNHLGKVIRLPGRALMAADDFFRVIASRGALYEEAVRVARASRAAGRTNAEAVDDGMMVLLDPKYAADQMDAESRYATMTSDLGDGLLGSFTTKFRSNPIGKLIMPFAKAPTNTMLRVSEGHPLITAASMLNPKSQISQNLRGLNGAKAQQRQMARLSMGAGTMYLFHQMALNGRITGSYPGDKQLQRMLPPGWQPYSFVFRDEGFPVDDDGDPLPLFNPETGLPNGPLKYISYQGLEPVSAFVGIAASTARHQTMFVDPEDRMNFMTASVAATAEYFRDLPMLQGIGDITRAFQYEDPTIITDGFLGGTTAVFPMPFSSVVRNIDRLSNTEKRTVEMPYQYYTVEDVQKLYDESQDTDNPYPTVPYSLVGTVKNWQDASWSTTFHDMVAYGWNTQIMNMPMVDKARTNFAYQYDMLGNKKERGVPFDINPVDAIWNSITPFKVSRGADIEPFHKELIRLGAPLTESKDKKKINGVTLDPIQRGELTDIAKNQIALPLQIQTKRGLRQQGPASYQFRDYVKVLMTHPAYVSADDDGRIKMIKNAEALFYRAAMPVLLAQPGNQELATAMAQRDQLKQMEAIQ